MLPSNHIFFIKLAVSFCLVLCWGNEAPGQAWIIETPTGKLSSWIIQRYPATPQKAELFLLNQTGHSVYFDEHNTNDNYLEIISPKGLRVITRRAVSGQPLALKNNPDIENSVRWDVDFSDYLRVLDFRETGNYLITWHVKTSRGLLSAEPVRFYFENKTNYNE